MQKTTGDDRMKLVRYGPVGQERPGILDLKGAIRDLSGVVADLAGTALGRESLDRIRALDLAALPLVQGTPRLGPPVGVVPKFLGIGLNYRDHAAETGAPLPEVPIVFAKASSCVSGPNDPVLAPRGFERMDYEVELAFIIGTRAKNVPEADALAHVAGYAVCNDISERSLQKGGPGEWIKAKSHDTFGPLGPWLVTTDEIPDPSGLRLRSWRIPGSGQHAGRQIPMQDGTTANMVFDVPALIAYVSAYIALDPGDLLITGTPSGVGVFRDPPVFLEPGDTVRCEIEGIGRVENRVIDSAATVT
jgi:2-keto-4-pentenoate hydratase/2-oxohepta-3-ene-1,7-dioic acid hydratase in catechol pathway